MARNGALAKALLVLLLVGCVVGCGGASSSSGIGKTTRTTGGGPSPPASADEPFVKGAVETDADIARTIRESYTKYEFRIPMRDGAKLFTVAYVPKDENHSYPILMARTPYGVGPYGVDIFPNDKNGGRVLRRFAPSPQIIKEGYIIVHQDVRGRMMSEGTFVDIRPHRKNSGDKIDESTDAFDTIDWLVKNVPNNTGKVGVWGISYPGFYAAQTAIDAHPALKAVSPQAPVTEWFLGDDFHHNGALFLSDAFDFYGSFGKARASNLPTNKWDWKTEHEAMDVYDFFLALGPVSNGNTKYLKEKIGFWNDLMAHPNRDEFWKARDPRPFYRDSKPAIMTVGGFLDGEDLYGALETYRAFEKQSPKNENVLVMGPWRHGGWARNDGDRHGDISFNVKSSLFYRERIELPFFQRHLKGKKAPAAAEAWIFESGTNVFRSFAAWPPADAKSATLLFQANGKLGTGASSAAEGDDAYPSDPKKPVPYRMKPGDSIDGEYMSDDQRFAARRPDVLVYSTADLTDDVTLGGPLEATLYVSTTGTDADFVVKLVDVWPAETPNPDPNPTNVHMGGYQQLIRAEIMRGKFRNSYERPEPFKPNEPTLVRFTLPDVSHAFRPGHRMMVQIQSSWFPLVDRNPQTFVESINKATDGDFRAATHHVFHTKDKPSGLKVTLLTGTLPN